MVRKRTEYEVRLEDKSISVSEASLVCVNEAWVDGLASREGRDSGVIVAGVGLKMFVCTSFVSRKTCLIFILDRLSSNKPASSCCSQEVQHPRPRHKIHRCSSRTSPSPSSSPKSSSSVYSFSSCTSLGVRSSSFLSVSSKRRVSSLSTPVSFGSEI